MTLYDRIRQRRIELNLSQDELATKLGYKSRSTIAKIEAGANDIPQSKIVAFAHALNTTPAYLMGWDDSPSDISVSNIIPLPSTRQVPMLGKIACGDPILAVENIDEYVAMPDTVRADFALTCKGESMINARILDGDIVYIHQQDDVENGEIAAIIIEDEATLKRVYKDPEREQLTLMPENPAYPPLVYRGEELNHIRIIGKVVAFYSPNVK